MSSAPDWLKKAFDSWVENWGWDDDRPYLYVEREVVPDVGDDLEWPLRRLLGKLWQCTDRLSEDMCHRLELPSGSTYAAAAQKISAAGREGRFYIPRSGLRVPPP